jgi:hypothetical protein
MSAPLRLLRLPCSGDEGFERLADVAAPKQPSDGGCGAAEAAIGGRMWHRGSSRSDESDGCHGKPVETGSVVRPWGSRALERTLWCQLSVSTVGPGRVNEVL